MTRRVFAIAVLLALIVGAAVVDRQVGRPHGAGALVAANGLDRTVQPVAAPRSSLTSTYYCVGAMNLPNLVNDARLVVLNTGDAKLTGTVTYQPSVGDAVRTSIEVGARTRVVARPRDALSATYVSATLELDGGEAAVEWVTLGPLGSNTIPCTTSSSDTWYFAEGATTRDAIEAIVLSNPFPADAVVDLTFSTDEGESAPIATNSLAVAPHSTRVVALNDVVRRREQVATAVHARVGRVVAARLQLFDGSIAGRKGLSIALGAPSSGGQWTFPEGYVVPGLTERYVVYNPQDREAHVTVDLALEKGQAEPIELTVAPQSRVTVVANDEGRIPKAVPHAALVRSDGAGVVVERRIDAGTPSPRAGLSITLGSRLAASRWALPAGEADKLVDEWLVLFNPSDRVAHVDVALLADGQMVAVEGLQGAEVQPGQRRAIRLGSHLQRLAVPLVVTADVPIVVERGMYPKVGTAMTIAIALP